MADDMAIIRVLPDKMLQFSKMEVENNKTFWKSISSTIEINNIADGYKRTCTVIKSYYDWVYDTRPTDRPVPYVPEKVEYLYVSPQIHMISMNWGWPNDNNTCEWYTLMGDWIAGADWTSVVNYSVNRKMIYGFQIL